MDRGIRILIVDDSELIAKNNAERVKSYCSEIANITNIQIATSFSQAYESAKEFVPDFIYSDLHLSPTEIGITLIEKLRTDCIIDYRTQCCYYTANPNSANLLPYIEKGRDFKLKKGATAEQFIEVFKLMLDHYNMCNLKYLVGASTDIYMHEVFTIEGKSGGCEVKYFSSFHDRLSQIFLPKKFSQAKESILSFDFMLQIIDYTIINMKYYRTYRTTIDARNNTSYFVVLKHGSAIKEYKISKSFVENFKRKYITL